jgi:pyrimidine oxygenase
MPRAGAAKKDFGVFLPVANGGWIVSEAAPPLDGGWRSNLDAALAAERNGLDFVLSMGKWRGFGGATNYWATSMESITMMAGIAQATSRIKVWATAHTLLHNPAVIAKMITTLDHVSGGRAGLNIVAGAYRDEFNQMGVWDDSLNHDDRYVVAEEWTTVIKRLWREPSVDFHGRFFHMTDCVSDPKPLSRPRPDLICAGQSDRGFQFSVREADACFIGGRSQAERREHSTRAKTIAAEMGKSIKTYAMCTMVHGETDAEAEAAVRRYDEAADCGAIANMLRSWGVAQGADAEQRARGMPACNTQMAVGSPATCAEQLASFIEECALDGVMLIFPDYVEGLDMFGREVLPRLAQAQA